MIDSHCHLDHDPLKTNLSNIVDRSKSTGIEKLLTICTTNKSFNDILEIVTNYEIVYGTYGIHPHECKNINASVDEIIEKVSLNNKIIGVGESGLDFYYNNSDKKSQLSSFKNHIEASIKLKIPIIVHSRNAEKETYDLLNDYKNENLKILMHCFTGSIKFAEKLMNLNAYFSASGIITFKNSIELRETFKKIPLKKILIETDSPFLAPIPMRGKKNEPSYIKYTAKKLAELKACSFDEIDKLTTNNFNSLFFN